MGRRKKDDTISYVQIVSSSYVEKAEYEKAQIVFSSALDDWGNLKNTAEDNFLAIDGESYWGDDEIYD